jgi:hypothetical protein
MRKRQTQGFDVRMATGNEGAVYCGMGLTAFRAWAEQIGAKRKFGRSTRYDMRVIDAALDAMATDQTTGQTMA